MVVKHDLHGVRFGSLVCLSVRTDSKMYNGRVHKYRMWKCACDCGGSTEVTTSDLMKGDTKRCKNCRKKKEKTEPRKKEVFVKPLIPKLAPEGGLTADPRPANIHALVHLNQFFTNPVIQDNQIVDDQNPQGLSND